MFMPGFPVFLCLLEQVTDRREINVVVYTLVLTGNETVA